MPFAARLGDARGGRLEVAPASDELDALDARGIFAASLSISASTVLDQELVPKPSTTPTVIGPSPVQMSAMSANWLTVADRACSDVGFEVVGLGPRLTATAVGGCTCGETRASRPPRSERLRHAAVAGNACILLSSLSDPRVLGRWV